MTIHYLTGDATYPCRTPALIMHVCNDAGKWGRGFVLALSKRWPQPEKAYRGMKKRPLGYVQYVPVDHDNITMVANIIGQHDIYTKNGIPPIRYEALDDAFERIQRFLTSRLVDDFTIHAPRLGCGLAGGTWDRIEPLLQRHFQHRDVYIYDLPETK